MCAEQTRTFAQLACPDEGKSSQFSEESFQQQPNDRWLFYQLLFMKGFHHKDILNVQDHKLNNPLNSFFVYSFEYFVYFRCL